MIAKLHFLEFMLPGKHEAIEVNFKWGIARLLSNIRLAELSAFCIKSSFYQVSALVRSVYCWLIEQQFSSSEFFLFVDPHFNLPVNIPDLTNTYHNDVCLWKYQVFSFPPFFVSYLKFWFLPKLYYLVFLGPHPAMFITKNYH